MKLHLLLVIALLSAATVSCAETPNCKQTEFGKCFAVHDRYNTYADGDAIWIIGTQRRLETVYDDLDRMLQKAGWQNHSILGDFIICPMTAYQPGHKQTVCIESYKGIRLVPWK
jgi:hypothetical protein